MFDPTDRNKYEPVAFDVNIGVDENGEPFVAMGLIKEDGSRTSIGMFPAEEFVRLTTQWTAAGQESIFLGRMFRFLHTLDLDAETAVNTMIGFRDFQNEEEMKKENR